MRVNSMSLSAQLRRGAVNGRQRKDYLINALESHQKTITGEEKTVTRSKSREINAI